MEPRAPPTSGGGSHLNAAPSAVVIPFGRPANKSWTEPSSSAAQVGSSSSAAAESVPDWWSAEVGEDELVYPDPNPNPKPAPKPIPNVNQVGEDELVYTTTPFSVGGPTRAVGKGKGEGEGEPKGKAKGQAKGQVKGGRGAGALSPAGSRDAESAVGKGRDAAAGGKGAAAAGGSGAEPAVGLPKGRKRKAKARKAKGGDADEELVYTTTPFSVDVDRPRKAPRAADTGSEGARRGPRTADLEGARKGPRSPSEIEGARKAPRATADVEGARAQRRRLEPDRQTGAETDSQAGRAPISPRPSAAAERRGHELQRRSERVCSFFAQGRCRNGDACRFSP